MNKTAESSFAPLEYYKKLTNCLANRKNLKLNISKIQGGRDFRLKSTPFITNRKIQVKFLANYNMRKHFNENQKQQREKLANKQGEAIFKVKNNAALNENLKRKTIDESYINLPDSYFKANQLPDLSVFKVPKIPPTKRQKIEILPNTVNTSNFTLTSLFSGNFNPPQFSTPIEREKAKKAEHPPFSTPIEREKANKAIVQPQPLITDPNDILGSFGYLQFHEEENHGTDKKEKTSTSKELDEMKYYKDLVDESSVYVETACFDDVKNPIKIIAKKVNNKHEDASQSPRPSLISSRSVQNTPIVFLEPPEEVKKTQSWPVPVFYDQSNHKIFDDFASINDDDFNPLFDDTKHLFSFLDEDDPLDLGMSAISFDQPRTSQTSILEFDDEPRTSQSSFFNRTPHPSANTFLASTQNSLTPYPSPRSGDDDMDWLGIKFANSMNMSWENESNFTFSTQRPAQRNQNFSAIFRSPPNTNCLQFKKPFSRTIERPKKYNRSESDESSSYKGEEFSWWYSDSDTNDNSILLSDTQDLFDTKCSLF